MIPDDLKYTKEHEWVSVSGDIAIIGITDYAQRELTDIVYVQLPATGDVVKYMEPFGEIEAVKAVSDLFSPVSGEVIEANVDLQQSPELVNNDPYGDGWMIKVRLADPGELDELLTAEEYAGLIGEE